MEINSPIYIYALCDPDTGDIRYVGKTNNLALRLRSHQNERRETRKCQWLKSLKRSGRLPLIRILEIVGEENWEDKERFWIAELRSYGVDLTNHTEGGDGVSGIDDEARRRLSAQMRKRMSDPAFRAKVFTEERSAKISEALSGKKKAPEHVAKLRQNQPGHTMSETAKRKISESLIGNSRRLGILHTNETKALLSKKGRGNPSRTGMKNTKEHNQRISDFQKGRPKTQEQRRKMALARKLWWERKKDVAQIPE